MKLLIPLLGLLFVLFSCTKNNPDPSWLVVTEWQLIANPNQQNETGELTQNFTDAWVYVDNEIIGVFEVPFKIPLLYDGTHEVKIYPTVLNNGISATKKIYPFVEPYIIDVDLVQNEESLINPVTMYKAVTDFWIEDFEDLTFDIVDGLSSIASISTSSDPTVLDNNINGGFFGRISLDETNNLWVGSTVANNGGTLNMDLPRGQEVYLEIDYHNTNNLVTGLLAIDGTGYQDNINIQLNQQDASDVHWKKIYIDLRELVSSSSFADYFEFSFQAALDEGESVGEINIDNIKAVYF